MAYQSFTAAITLILILASTTDSAKTKDVSTLKVIIDDYVASGSIEEFCDDFDKAFSAPCKEDISLSESTEFYSIAKAGSRKAIINYININLLKQDMDMELNEEECAKFHKRLRELAPTDFLDYLRRALQDRGREINPSTRRSSLIRQNMAAATATGSCNLGPIAAHFGKVSKLGLTPLSAIKQIRDFVGDQYKSIKTAATNDDYIRQEAESEEEKKKAKEAQSIVESRKEAIKDLNRGCLIDSNEAKCASLARAQNILILDKLGPMVTKLVLVTPALRDIAYSAAELVEGWETTSLRSSIRDAGNVVVFMTENAPAAMVVLFILLCWFRKDIGNVMSVCLAASGLGIIPLLKAARLTFTITVARAKSTLMSIAIAFAVYGINTAQTSVDQAISVVYCVMVFYFMISEKQRNILEVIGIVSPLLIYSAAKIGGYNFNLATVKEDVSMLWSTKEPNFWLNFIDWKIPEAQLLPSIALATLASIMILCELCNKQGYETYRDVFNNKTGKTRVNEFKASPPAITQYLMSGFSYNVLLVLGIATIPGLYSPAAWFWSISVFSISTFLASLLYHASYHDSFVKEGETAGATPERILENMNIIVGLAPKNIILPKFQSHVCVALCLAAFIMGTHMHSVTIGTLLAVAVCMSVQRNPAGIFNYLGWASGFAIAFSGSMPHMVLGLAYLVLRFNNLLHFDLSTMGIGSILREPNLS